MGTRRKLDMKDSTQRLAFVSPLCRVWSPPLMRGEGFRRRDARCPSCLPAWRSPALVPSENTPCLDVDRGTPVFTEPLLSTEAIYNKTQRREWIYKIIPQI